MNKYGMLVTTNVYREIKEDTSKWNSKRVRVKKQQQIK